MSSLCLCHSHSHSNRQLGLYLFFTSVFNWSSRSQSSKYIDHTAYLKKKNKNANLQEFISHLRNHAAQSQDDIMQHSKTIEELKQKLSAVEQGLMHIKEEDANVQIKKKQSRDQLRQLQTELEQAYTKHSVAQYTNAQHATRLQMALGLDIMGNMVFNSYTPLSPIQTQQGQMIALGLPPSLCQSYAAVDLCY